MFSQLAISSLLFSVAFAVGHDGKLSTRQQHNLNKRQAAAGASTAGSMTVATPASLVECQPALLSWEGGNGPYFPSIIPGGQPSAAPLESFDQTTDNSLTWKVDIPSGTSVTFQVKDSSGAVQFASQVTIQPGTDSSCVGQNAAASSSAASSVSSAVASASSAVSSGINSVSSRASSAASAASSGAHSVASAASSAANSVSSAASAAGASATGKSSGASQVIGSGIVGLLGAVVAAML